MNTSTLRRGLIFGALWLAVGVTFIESWGAMVGAAREGGRPIPELWPMATEALIAIVIATYWEARSQGRPKIGWLRLLLAGLTGVTAGFLILDGLADTDAVTRSWAWWLRVGTAGWTPVALFIGIELAMWLLHGGTRDEGDDDTADEGDDGEVVTVNFRRDTLKAVDELHDDLAVSGDTLTVIDGTRHPSSAPSSVSPMMSPMTPSSMKVSDAVRTIIIKRSVDPHHLTAGDILDEVRTLTGKPTLSRGAVANALTIARKRASTNGGVRVR